MTSKVIYYAKNPHKPLAERFWEKVKKSSPDICWEWQANKNKKGYGKFKTANGVQHPAHRAAWELTNGLIHSDLLVLHRCDNPSCVNPRHLFLGTAKDNMQDAAIKNRMKGALNAKKGSANISAKLTESNIPIIIKLQKSGISMRVISRKFKVDYRIIWGICAGIIWKHVAR